jgi:hypothetical protein
VYSLRVRLLASSAGVVAVESGEGGLRVQLPLEHGLDLLAVSNQWRQLATATATRILIGTEPARRGAGWLEVLPEVLRELGRLRRVRARVSA